MPSPRPKAIPSPPLRKPSGQRVLPVEKKQSLFAPYRFILLNECYTLHDPSDWDNQKTNKLLLYNLHYFDDLNSIGAANRREWHRALVNRWLEEVPPGLGNGWEPFPLSLRIVNWVKWCLCGNIPWQRMLDSLATQTRFLARRLEYHLLGNHLLANAKALIFSGLFFSGTEADEWLQKGIQLLQNEIRGQILADGGHFERSPMYHAIVLEDLLDLLNVIRLFQPSAPDRRSLLETLTETTHRMRTWLQAMCHPDGEIALFNDSALGISPTQSALEDYALRLGLKALPQFATGLKTMSESGYIRVQKSDAVAFLDVGPIGPDYQPGHAHADTLSFELSIGGRRVIVNSGTSCYGNGPERHRQRSTVSHNTVILDGENSSEVWGGFRVARRAKPSGLQIEERNSKLEISCSHTGYMRLPGRNTHRREWRIDDNEMHIKDEISGVFSNAVARFHFHPDAVLECFDSAIVGRLMLENGRRLQWQVIIGRPSIKTSSYHPEFGVSHENRCLEVRFTEPYVLTSFRWS